MNKKNIWILHHYADPPNGQWTGTFDLHKILARKGHSVTIFTSSFSHYTRRDDRLKSKENHKEIFFDKVRFLFIKTAPYFKNGLQRLINMLGFSWKAYKIGLKEKQKPDIVIGSSPHPFSALAAFFLAKKTGAKFYFEVHDLWPQFLIEIGALGSWHPLTFLLRQIEKFCCQKADRILPLWPKMNLYFEEQYGIPESKVLWMPMGVDPEILQMSHSPDPHSRKENEVFTVMYRGRFGLTNDVTTILKTAELIQKKRNDIHFVLVGEGPERKELEEIAKKANLQNVEFRNFLPKEMIQKDMANADLLIGSLPDLPHFRKYGMISTKVLEYLGSNRPIIFATSITDHIVQKAEAGFIAPPNNPEKLAESIYKIFSLTAEERMKMGRNGIRYLQKYHDLTKLAENLENTIYEDTEPRNVLSKELPTVSILIPCRNEILCIQECLNSIIENDYPKDLMELIIVDGMSEDGTREILKKFQEKFSWIRLLDNPGKEQQLALNIGIKNATGKIIMRMGAHDKYTSNYITECIKALQTYPADNVGGGWVAIPRNDNLIGRAICFAMSAPFGVGNAYYRLTSLSNHQPYLKEPRWEIHIAYPCCRREVFEKIGPFNENLSRSEDIDFRSRLKKAGFRTLYVPTIRCYYFMRTRLGEFLRHMFLNGQWVLLPLNHAPNISFSLRHAIPLLFLLSLGVCGIMAFFSGFFAHIILAILGFYLLLNIYFSFRITLREKDLRYFFILLPLFSSLHFAYGLGSIIGSLRTLISKLKNFFTKTSDLKTSEDPSCLLNK